MKKLFLSAIFAITSFTSNSQVVFIPETNYPFYSDVFRFEQSEYENFLELVPLDKRINLAATPIILNEGVVRANMIDAINRLRAQYGVKPIKYNKTLSADINAYVTRGIPATLNGAGVLTRTEYGTFQTFNYVRNFQNKEAKFCDMLLDEASLNKDTFLQLINPKATIVGFCYSQNIQDKTYEFNLCIK
jgi:hypothetical protein